jgi:asparagine synthase (glutamine-hydrolysing)
MCGIAGVIGIASAAEGQATVKRMTDTIIYRGPDDEGHFADAGLAFGMRRLSIIDLAQGHQPIWSDNGAGIILNGEIYNYRALRADLAARGARFRTQSDTEVILKSYEAEGLACLARLEGMFAFCLYDPARRQFHLVRDRLGKKPLYYAAIDGRFYFASEIKAILAALPQRPALDRQSLSHYLTLRYVPSPGTIWQGIQKLEPGSSLTYDLAAGTFSIARYWSLQFRSAAPDPGRDYVGEFERLLLAAVEKRLVAADVPVGVLLSGGLDSSSVAAAAVELGHRAFHTFSVAFAEGGEADETEFAREVAQKLGSRHSEIVIDRKKFLDFLPELVRFTDEPLADLASVPLYYVSRLARQDVKVVLSGEGADEMLAGYDFDDLARALDRLRGIARTVPRAVLAMLARLVPGRAGSVLGDLAHAGYPGLLAARRTHMTRVWTDAEKSLLWRNSEKFAPTDAMIGQWYEAADSPEPLDQILQIYCRSWLVEDLLMKADRMSMANSLELRCPFLDHALAEWSARLPLEWKVGSAGRYRSKRILREFAARRLPKAILDRPKRGFPVPANRWLETDLAAWAEDRLLRGRRMEDWFNPAPIRAVLDAAKRGSAAAQNKVWNLLILDHWFECWQ